MQDIVITFWALWVLFVAGLLFWMQHKREQKNGWYRPAKNDEPIRFFGRRGTK